MAKEKKPKKVVFSEEIDSRIDGLTLGFAFVVVGLFLLFVPDYFGSKLAGQIIRWIFIGIGALGLFVEFGKLKAYFSDCKREISSAIDSQIQSKNVDPIIDSVKLIPLPEMAFLAESLVNITSLKRTYAIDGNQQTVGGPTDVAVLSKGDGFVWIKRKLYFNKDLNPNYK